MCEMVIRLVGDLSSWAGFNKPETNARWLWEPRNSGSNIGVFRNLFAGGMKMIKT